MLKEGEPTLEEVKIETHSEEISSENILGMSPKELMDYFVSLHQEGKLETFLNKSLENNSLVAKFSYWEKWLEQNHQKLIDCLVAEKKKLYPGDSESLPLNVEEKFSADELKLIFSNLGSIQLTFGCSKGCPFCGFDAPLGTRDYIPYSQLANLFQRYGKQINKTQPFLYWASEPSDYISREHLENKTYQDVHQLAIEYAGYSPHITSRETRNNAWLNFLKLQNMSEGGARVSVYGLSQKETEIIKEKTNSEVGIVGENTSHIKGLGRSFSFSEFGQQSIGIGCFNGVLLTPRGLYNVIQVPLSEKFPQGQIVVPIEKQDNKAIKKGDSILNILKGNIAAHIRLDTPFVPFFHIWSGDKLYCVAIDEDYKVSAVEQSGIPKALLSIDEYYLDQIKQVSEDPISNSHHEEKETLISELKEARDNRKCNFLEALRDDYASKKEIEKAHTLKHNYKFNIEELERYGFLRVKIVKIDSACFSSLQLELRLPGFIPYIAYFISHSDRRIDEYWEKSANITSEDIFEKFGKEINFHLDSIVVNKNKFQTPLRLFYDFGWENKPK
ncbi:MAG: hypothetical protein M1338_03040 [Patescibacteria group bacterium]|nr:hypothetical protein [Patescibacteria group bacterium]